MLNLVIEAVRAENPDVEVQERKDPMINLGACEVYHGDKILYSKKKSGLWPNPKAIGIRVKEYFQDLQDGKSVEHYGQGPEVAYKPPKKFIDPFARSSMYGFYGGSTQSGDNQTPEKSSRQNEENEEKDKGEQVGGMEDPGENGEGPHEEGDQGNQEQDLPQEKKEEPEKTGEESKPLHEEYNTQKHNDEEQNKTEENKGGEEEQQNNNENKEEAENEEEKPKEDQQEENEGDKS